MILVSVGTQLPFDRLVKVVDDWAGARQREDVVAQVGPSKYTPHHIKCFDFIGHDEFFTLQSRCDVMVSHAGMGSIITALELGKPIIILARDHRRQEHRNGHQLDTWRQFSAYPGIFAARDEEHLVELLDYCDTLKVQPSINSSAPQDFLEKLQNYVRDEPESGWGSRIKRLFGKKPANSARQQR